jgi:hypothetical protein
MHIATSQRTAHVRTGHWTRGDQRHSGTANIRTRRTTQQPITTATATTTGALAPRSTLHAPAPAPVPGTGPASQPTGGHMRAQGTADAAVCSCCCSATVTTSAPKAAMLWAFGRSYYFLLYSHSRWGPASTSAPPAIHSKCKYIQQWAWARGLISAATAVGISTSPPKEAGNKTRE